MTLPARLEKFFGSPEEKAMEPDYPPKQSPELIALAKYLARKEGWGTEPIPKKYQSEASAIFGALRLAGFEIVARADALEKEGT